MGKNNGKNIHLYFFLLSFPIYSDLKIKVKSCFNKKSQKAIIINQLASILMIFCSIKSSFSPIFIKNKLKRSFWLV